MISFSVLVVIKLLNVQTNETTNKKIQKKRKLCNWTNKPNKMILHTRTRKKTNNKKKKQTSWWPCVVKHIWMRGYFVTIECNDYIFISINDGWNIFTKTNARFIDSAKLYESLIYFSFIFIAFNSFSFSFFVDLLWFSRFATERLLGFHFSFNGPTIESKEEEKKNHYLLRWENDKWAIQTALNVLFNDCYFFPTFNFADSNFFDFFFLHLLFRLH